MADIQLATISRSGLRDPVFLQFVDEVSKIMKLEVLLALSAQRNPARFSTNLRPAAFAENFRARGRSVGSVVKNWVSTLPTEKKNMVLRQYVDTASIAPDLRRSMRELNIKLDSNKYVLDQVDLQTKFSFVKTDFENRLLSSRINITDLFPGTVRIPVQPRPVREGLVVTPNDGASSQPSGQPSSSGGGGGTAITINKGLKFEVDRVTCIDETDPEWLGKDEIAMGGAAIDDKENVTKITDFIVGSFDDGQQKDYNPDKELKSFDLSGEYPKTFATFIAIAEKDVGGFSDFLQELYEAIKKEVTVIMGVLGVAAGAWIGASIGGTVGTAVGGPIGAIIGIAAGLILGALVAFLVDASKDDLFEPQVATVTFPTADATFQNGTLESPNLGFLFEGHGGQYKVDYKWRIVR